MKFRLLALLALIPAVMNAAEPFITFSRSAETQLKLTQSTDTIAYASEDWEGVKIAVRNLRQDLKAVTGSEKAPVIVGTVGKSPIAAKI